MKIIVPCCGRSSRFPGQPPKWMLPAPDGQPMLRLALSGLPVELDDLIVTILREHEETFDVEAGLASRLRSSDPRGDPRESNRQPIGNRGRNGAQVGLDEPFLVKDSDGYFHCPDLTSDANYICVDTLNHFDLINPRNKSYVQVDSDDRILAMREKVVISDLFNVGGYFFHSPAEFLRYYDSLAGAGHQQRAVSLERGRRDACRRRAISRPPNNRISRLGHGTIGGEHCSDKPPI